MKLLLVLIFCLLSTFSLNQGQKNSRVISTNSIFQSSQNSTLNFAPELIFYNKGGNKWVAIDELPNCNNNTKSVCLVKKFDDILLTIDDKKISQIERDEFKKHIAIVNFTPTINSVIFSRQSESSVFRKVEVVYGKYYAEFYATE